MTPSSYLSVSSKDVDPIVSAPSQFSKTKATTAHMATTTFKVSGMTCGACTSAVEGGFKDADGVGSVSVSLVMERAVVQHDPARFSAENVKDMIEDCGFDAEVLSSDMPVAADQSDSEEEGDEHLLEDVLQEGMVTTTLSVEGMTCGACTSAVEGGFKGVAGVRSFQISLLSERAVVEHDLKVITPEKIAEIIEDTGFDAKVLDTKATESRKSTKRSQRRGSKGNKFVTTTVAVEGMTCGACTSAVESGFKDIEGVIQFNISLLAERAVVVHDATRISAAQIAEIIEDRGFDAKVLSSQEEGAQTLASSSSVQLKIYGLRDLDSAAALETSLRSLAGISSASVSFSTTRASITHRSSVIGLRAIVKAIEAEGYNALVADSEDNNAQLESLAKTKEIQEWRAAFHISLMFAIPVFLTSMVFPMFIPFLDYGSIKLPLPGLWLGDAVCLILTVPIQFGIGRRFYVSAFRSLRHGSPTMDVLVVLGTSAAFFFSIAAMLVSILTPPHSRPATVFDTSTMLITFITLGRYLENRAKGQTSKALSQLMNLTPSQATIYADPIEAAKAAEEWDESAGLFTEKNEEKTSARTAAEEMNVPTELIEVGDMVILKPGDKIPADGTVTRGESYVDESMVTGEAMPILKKKGALLMAGTVNGAGRVDFKVTRAGRDTQLSQIVKLVQAAQTSRAPIQRMADIVAGYFVPVIITLGLSTFVAWMVLSHSLPHPPEIFLDHKSGGRSMVCMKLCISVIVFACPCALGLATPTAVMVGTGVGAEQGILVKGGAALETATKITHVVLDKTGTLTMGKMSVSKTDIQSGWTDSAERTRLWWTMVGLAEMGSEHPIARAIVNGAKGHLGLGPDGPLDGSVGDFEATVGKGISASVEAAISPERKRYRVLIGNVSFLRANGIELPASVKQENSPYETADFASSSKSSSAGTTTIHTAIDTCYTGCLHLSDTLKPTARAAIAALHRMKISTSIVTGDQENTAQYVASLIGIVPENVHATVLPSGKQTIIEDLQRTGAIVAMVGDGINDSPALATANIGISLASGTDIAMEAADIVLMRPDNLLDIAASLQLSRTIFTRIKMNLLWAVMYNVIGLPVAMGFFLPWGWVLPPMAAGAAMACSSVTVVGSSLLLRLWKRPRWMTMEKLDPASVVGLGGKEGRVTGNGVVMKGVRWVTGVAARATRRGRREEERGAYVALDTYEAV
ncbi:E1-E2 ATPase-domain-containing protein [Cryomyces antarcticus]